MTSDQPNPAPRPRTGLPLEGLRILDITVVWAGPYGTMQLADWGAEVIRIESTQRMATSTRGDMARPPQVMVDRGGALGYAQRDGKERPWNRHTIFNSNSRNKLSMTVDITKPEGWEVFEELVRRSDGLIENNVPVSMERLGVTWERLSAINPRFVLVRQPGFGLEGPYKNYRTWGNHMESLSGHPALRAYPEEDLDRGASGVPSDAAGGIGGALAMMVGLRQRERTGKGVMIELPTAENFVPFLGDFIMDFSMNGRVHTQLANQHLYWAPHNVYACAGNDRWLTIACRDDPEFQKLCEVMGASELASDDRFKDSLTRWENRGELDGIIGSWTETRDATELMHRLQAAGVPAGAVMDEADALADPHMEERGFYETLTHPEIDGEYRHPGPLFRMESGPNHLWRHAPRLGEDNEYVYKQVLGFTDEKYAEFERTGHIGMDYDPSVP